MTKTALALLASVMLCSGCAPRTTTLPDRSVPHRVAATARVQVWVRRPDGLLAREVVLVEPDWWVAAPEAVR